MRNADERDVDMTVNVHRIRTKVATATSLNVHADDPMTISSVSVRLPDGNTEEIPCAIAIGTFSSVISKSINLISNNKRLYRWLSGGLQVAAANRNGSREFFTNTASYSI